LCNKYPKSVAGWCVVVIVRSMVGLYEGAVHLYAQSTAETMVRVAGVEPA
jgi:hypothetical protein